MWYLIQIAWPIGLAAQCYIFNERRVSFSFITASPARKDILYSFQYSHVFVDCLSKAGQFLPETPARRFALQPSEFLYQFGFAMMVSPWLGTDTTAIAWIEINSGTFLSRLTSRQLTDLLAAHNLRKLPTSHSRHLCFFKTPCWTGTLSFHTIRRTSVLSFIELEAVHLFHGQRLYSPRPTRWPHPDL